MRPLFPDDYRNDVSLNNLVLCVDQDCPPEITAMLGSSIATSISDIPFDGPIASTIVGLIDGEFVYNPNSEQREKSEMALTVASTMEKIVMIEASANEVPEDKMIEAIFAAHDLNKTIIEFINKIVADCGKEKHDYTKAELPEGLYEDMVNFITPEGMEKAVFTDVKQVREANIGEIKEKLLARYEEEQEEWLPFLDEAIYQFQKNTVRKMILNDKKRPDGRKIDEIRKLTARLTFYLEPMVLVCLPVVKLKY